MKDMDVTQDNKVHTLHFNISWRIFKGDKIDKTLIKITLSVLQTKQNTYANSIDPDEMAHNEQSHLDLHCLPFNSDF